MRLGKERIDSISSAIVKGLIEGDLIILVGQKEDELHRGIAEVIIEELTIEDRLNEEVREIMKAHTDEIGKDDVDYGRMFQMIKNKLVRERGIII